MFRAPCTGWCCGSVFTLPSSHPIVPPSYVTPEQIAGGVSVLKDLNFSVDGLGKMPKGVPVIRR